MQRVNVNSADIEYEVQGWGDRWCLSTAESSRMRFYSLRAEPCIANNFRVIAYHRRGFAGSTRARPGNQFLVSIQIERLIKIHL